MTDKVAKDKQETVAHPQSDFASYLWEVLVNERLFSLFPFVVLREELSLLGLVPHMPFFNAHLPGNEPEDHGAQHVIATGVLCLLDKGTLKLKNETDNPA